MNRYKIALVQMDCYYGEPEKNVEKASASVREAAANGASLICLPEAFNTGYLAGKILDMKNYAEKLDGKTTTAMCALAKELGVYLLAPILLLADNGEVENTAVLIGKDGAVIGTYSKTHPVGDERKYFQRGTKYPVWDTELGKIGVVICYDACFPETTRMLALQGADLILVPAAWRASAYFKEWWDLNIACRALDNLTWVAAVNRCGVCGDEIFAGKTQVVGPVGNVLCEMGVEEEGILYEEIDLSILPKEREFNTVMIDRHPEDYGMILEDYRTLSEKGE